VAVSEHGVTVQTKECTCIATSYIRCDDSCDFLLSRLPTTGLDKCSVHAGHKSLPSTAHYQSTATKSWHPTPQGTSQYQPVPASTSQYRAHLPAPASTNRYQPVPASTTQYHQCTKRLTSSPDHERCTICYDWRRNNKFGSRFLPGLPTAGNLADVVLAGGGAS
jgi:hypothetical protein